MTKQDDLGNSRPYDPGYSPVGPKISKLTGQLAGEIEKVEGRSRKRSAEHQAVFQILLGRVVANLYSAYKLDNGLYVAIRRGKWKKKPPDRYLILPYRPNTLLNILDGLKHPDLNYIEEHLGFQDKGAGKSKLTRIRAKQKLIDLVDEMLSGDDAKIQYRPSALIQLKDKEKNLIAYPDTEETNRMRDNLERINDFNSRHKFELCISQDEDQDLKELLRKDKKYMRRKKGKMPEFPKYDSAKNKLYRVFNNSTFEHDGRFYGGWWQSQPKVYRPFIRIDGHRTREFDYSGMIVYILYSKEKAEPPEGDAYALDGYDPDIYRDTIKKAVQSIMNTTGRINTKGYKYPPGKRYKDLINDLTARHQPISKYFKSGIGMETMRTDSDIAESVMLKMIERDIPVLPIHDSFIIPSTPLKVTIEPDTPIPRMEAQFHNEKALITAMAESYRQIIGSDPTIELEKSWDLQLLFDRLTALKPGQREFIAKAELTDNR